MESATVATATPDPTPEERAARLVAYEAYRAQCRVDSINGYIRTLTRAIDQEGIPRVDRQIPPGYEFATEADRWRVWLFDSLLWAYEEIQAGHALYAFRALLQAAGYAGRLGFYPAHASDAYTTLRNLLEDVIRTGEGS